ncbi:hypothetical protein BLA13014_01890 [Burkholderia aenigmatica]|uniref:Uncharacterized protein n=1 Tax=Burkholderia aenigmatica TaxID=2015348 RepID=A0A6P2JPE1_9BURK|nr:hypothetical protein BLA13014_01890 [Burkholderia aenigmatica]
MPIVKRISATFGSAMIARKRLRQSGWSTTSGACAVASRAVPAVVVAVWPSSWRARSAGSCAIRSTTCCARASFADRLTASRTARSAHSALRPRSCARPRIYAEASCIALRISVDCVSLGSAACVAASDAPDVPDAPGVPPGARGAAGFPPGGAAPPIPNCTGDAAPRLVPGAIAAKWLA